MPVPASSARAASLLERLESPLPTLAAPLRLGGEPADATFRLDGRLAEIIGHERHGIQAIRVRWRGAADGHGPADGARSTHVFSLASNLSLADAEAVAIEVSPVGIERRLRLDTAEVIERAFVSRELPAAILEWSAPEGASLRIGWRLPGTEHIAAERALYGEDADHRWAIFASREPERWSVDDAGHSVLETTLDPGQSLRLAFLGTVGAEISLDKVIDGFDPTATVYALSAAGHSIQQRRLTARAPDERIGQAISWAIHRLDSAPAFDPGETTPGPRGTAGAPSGSHEAAGLAPDPREAVWAALAAIATGNPASARALLDAWLSVSAGDGHPAQTAPGTAHRLLLAARLLAWTGDISRARADWPRVLATIGRLLPDALGSATELLAGHRTADDIAVWVAALQELGLVAESIGDEAEATRLRDLARQSGMAATMALWDAREGRLASRIDPPESSSSGPSPSRRWTRAFEATPRLGVPLVLDIVDPARLESWFDLVETEDALGAGWMGWAAYAAGRAEEGYALWRRAVEAGFRTRRGAWATAESTALVVLGFVHGILGAAPDATRHRLTLRPQLPKAWRRLEVERLRVGDAEVTFRYLHETGKFTFELDQTTGAVPVTAIFEPLIEGRVRTATVDGQPADLDTRPWVERTIVPVQLVLDHPRTIEIHVEDHER